MKLRNKPLLFLAAFLMLSSGCAPASDDSSGETANPSAPSIGPDQQGQKTVGENAGASDHDNATRPGSAQAEPNAAPSALPESGADQNSSSGRSQPSPAPNGNQYEGDSAASSDAASAGAPAPAEPQVSDEDAPEEPEEPEDNWVQLSTDDSTSMASAQMYKSNAHRFGLKAHEFVNYYDPPSALFDEEGWAKQADVNEGIQFGIKAVFHEANELIAPEPMMEEEPGEAHDDPEEIDEEDQDDPQALPAPRQDMDGDDSDLALPPRAGRAEVLFQLRADQIAHDVRRNWNLFLCVDVSGSMRGEKNGFHPRRTHLHARPSQER